MPLTQPAVRRMHPPPTQRHPPFPKLAWWRMRTVSDLFGRICTFPHLFGRVREAATSSANTFAPDAPRTPPTPTGPPHFPSLAAGLFDWNIRLGSFVLRLTAAKQPRRRHRPAAWPFAAFEGKQLSFPLRDDARAAGAFSAAVGGRACPGLSAPGPAGRKRSSSPSIR